MDLIEQFQQNIVQRQPLNDLQVKSHSNPFNVILISSKSSSKDGISFKLGLNSSEPTHKPIHLLVAWAVRIETFYTELERNISDILYPVGFDPIFLQSIALNVQHEIISADFSNLSQKEFQFKVPEGPCTELFAQMEAQQSVRNHYHVVVVLFRDSDELASLMPDDIVANVNIYHLRDNKMESKHIQNLIKFKNNRVANLNKMFVEDENLCVVCQTSPADQVLLPCSHKCICSVCIHRVNRKCPLCRSPITNKFEVNS